MLGEGRGPGETGPVADVISGDVARRIFAEQSIRLLKRFDVLLLMIACGDSTASQIGEMVHGMRTIRRAALEYELQAIGQFARWVEQVVARAAKEEIALDHRLLSLLLHSGEQLTVLILQAVGRHEELHDYRRRDDAELLLCLKRYLAFVEPIR